MSLLEVRDLTVRFGDRAVVDGVSFDLDAGERLGVIGESGSGKTLTALSVLGLAPDHAVITGSIAFQGRELLGRGEKELARLRGSELAVVFQSPLSSLNPLMRVGRQISEPARIHQGISRSAAAELAIELCRQVGLPDPEHVVRAFPHQLSGGQRQRVAIAAALACRPALLIADEPTTALDVTVQREVLELLTTLIAQEGTALMFITHDLALVSQVTDHLVVMRHGAIVERGATRTLVAAPEHAYTTELLAAARATAFAGEPAVQPVDVVTG